MREAGGDFMLVERETPEVGPGHVRIAVEACGVCHSDAFVKFGAMGKLPRVPGHEVAGVIDAVGEGVTQLAVGDRVGVGWHGGHCFTCESCRRGDFIGCTNGSICGVTYDGGYADYVVARAEAVARIPDELSAVDAGPLLCAGVTTYNSLRNSGARPGDTVAILGIGGLGHLGVQYAQRMGFRTVAISRGADKAALATELGAHDYIDAKANDTAEALQAIGGADVILATAPNGDAISGALGGLKRRGKRMIVAAASEPLTVNGFALLSGKTIHGWPSGSSVDSEDTMRFSARTGVLPRIERFGFEQAEEAYAKMMENRVRFRAVLVP
ncbi:MAG: alcohol dehydrogenase catalytic domain-containing protein [Planctomycetes bacterium]|nr:alcohol dehydrogenase catalytic domain-containing protein [Planctomycetota bacterium]